MQLVYKLIKAKNRDINQFDVSQVSKYSLEGALLKQKLLLLPSGWLSLQPSRAFSCAEPSVGKTGKTRIFSFSVKMIRSFESSKNRMGTRRPPRAIDKVPQNLWLTPIFNYSGHLGHKSTKVPISRAWLPPMGDYLVGNRNRVAVINSHLALERASKGLYLSATVLRKKGHILVVDTRGETSPLPNLIENSSHDIPTSISFSGPRWMGGSLTNWASISVMVRRCAQISKQFDDIITQNRTHIPRYEKMRNAFPGFIKTSRPNGGHKWVSDPLDGGGFVGHPWPSKGRPTNPFMKAEKLFLPGVREKEAENFPKFHQARLRFKRRPDLLWILNPNENRHVIEEAKRLSIPTIGIVDSNTDLSSLNVSIPANDNGSFLVNQLLTILITLSKTSSICLQHKL